MKLKTILHTGLTVSNLDKSVEFYQDVLGLELIFRVDDRAPGWNNDYIGRLVGIPNAELREAWLALGDHVVELVEYLSPKVNRHPRHVLTMSEMSMCVFK